MIPAVPSRRFLLTVDGLSFDIEVPAGASIVRVRNLAPDAVLPRAETEPIPVLTDSAPAGLSEFAQSFPHPPATYARKYAAVAYYLRRIDGKDTVAQSEVSSLCVAAGWGRAKNVHRDMLRAAELGYFASVEDGRYRLTERGEAEVVKYREGRRF